jgi:hypothetical protein
MVFCEWNWPRAKINHLKAGQGLWGAWTKIPEPASVFWTPLLPGHFTHFSHKGWDILSVVICHSQNLGLGVFETCSQDLQDGNVMDLHVRGHHPLFLLLLYIFPS